MPVQSNSRRKRLRSRRGEFAPWLMTAGRIAARRFSRTYRNAGALRRADPLVQVAGVVRRADRADVEREHARRVRAVDQRVDAARGQLLHDPLDGEDQRRLAGDVVDEQQPRAVGDFLQHALDDDVRRANREGDVGDDHLRAGDCRST